MTKQNRNYSCSDTNLYQACRRAWQICEQHLSVFNQFSQLYDANFLAQQHQKINHAEGLGNDQARHAQSQTERDALLAIAEECYQHFQILKRYVVRAFPDKNEQKNRLEEAGQSYFQNARAKNWEFTSSLLVSMRIFVETHEARLAQNAGMPANFRAKTTQIEQDFSRQFQSYLREDQRAQDETHRKVVENNELFADLGLLLGDARIILRNQPQVLANFNFAALLQNVSGVGIAGIKGRVYDAITNEPIANATIQLMEKGKTLTSDSNGRYEWGQLPAGDQNVTVEAAGYEPFTATVKISAGVTKRHNVALSLKK